jgi:hypothetical protein
MKLSKRVTMLILSALLLASLSVPCSAADNAFKDTLESAAYGGLVGAMVGGALLAFTKKPADHLDYLSYGAAGGVLAGTAYGVARYSKSLVSVEDGNVKFAMPTIIPEFQEPNSRGASTIAFKAELIRGKF